MPGLRVLKLKRIGLRDTDIETLAEAAGLRLRSLDIRDNRITDSSVRSLLTHCFHPVKDIHARQRQTSRARLAEEDWPSGAPRLDARVMDEYRGDDLDERFVKKLTRSVVGRMPSEDLPHAGITHLYIANNFITMEGLASLIRTENLHVLDARAVDTAKSLGRRRPLSISSPFDFDLPGSEKLTPVLEEHAGSNLTSLRVHHAVVTAPTALKDELTPIAELGGDEVDENALRTELQADHNTRHELGNNRGIPAGIDPSLPLYEMPGDDPAPLYELQAEPVPISVSEDHAERQDDEQMTEPQVNRGAAFAPEVAVEEGIESTPMRPPDFIQRSSQSIDSIDGQRLHAHSPTNFGTTAYCAEEVASSNTSSIEIAKLEARRNEIRHGVRDESRGLLPGLVPSLQSLILTDVPNTDDLAGTIVKVLKQFISDCAQESHLACTQAKLEFPSLYVPGKPRSLHAQHRSSELFGLRQLVLEMAPQTIAVSRPRSSSNTSLSPQDSPMTPPARFVRSTFDQRNRSSTGDLDTENFWSAQEDDFSFFGEEECGLPAREPGQRVPRSVLNQKMAMMSTNDSADGFQCGSGAGVSALSPSTEHNEVGKSVVAELAKWRAERKKLAQRLGKCDAFVEGYWKGEVKIVRPNVGGKNGFVDWYGNYFEKSYYYP
ncbi:MAG: hypothetical protein MMC23_003156 [Stictis urceolatum]|nr:hypothetical protein [Stictis urceolata]